MGCPVNKVAKKSGAGASLLQEPEKVYEKFKDTSEAEKVDMLISKTTGYAGDLFAAFYDLSSSKSYEKRIEDEFLEIENPFTKSVRSFKIKSAAPTPSKDDL